jgi:SAM-dependent methyltransferase
MKLHLGCGSNILPGWDNHDKDVDLTKPLPFADDSFDFIFTEHVIEHLSPVDGWRFFIEARRVLKDGGIIRTAFPDPARIVRRYTKEYLEVFNPCTGQPRTVEGALNSIISDWGHKSIWTVDGMTAILSGLGMPVEEAEPGESSHPELAGLERHGRIIGHVEAIRIQTSVLEATKNLLYK